MAAAIIKAATATSIMVKTGNNITAAADQDTTIRDPIRTTTKETKEVVGGCSTAQGSPGWQPRSKGQSN